MEAMLTLGYRLLNSKKIKKFFEGWTQLKTISSQPSDVGENRKVMTQTLQLGKMNSTTLSGLS